MRLRSALRRLGRLHIARERFLDCGVVGTHVLSNLVTRFAVPRIGLQEIFTTKEYNWLGYVRKMLRESVEGVCTRYQGFGLVLKTPGASPETRGVKEHFV